MTRTHHPGSGSTGIVPAPGSDPVEAVSALVDAHGARLHALALRLCGNAADAEDMVQEVFLQCLRKWHTFRGESDPGTWMYAIAARACKARLRRKGGTDRRQVPVSQLMPWSESSVMEIALAPEGEESPAERAEAVARVQDEIARLPEHLRLPLVLRDVLEMTVEDTGVALGLAPNTVKTRVHRARLALRKAMTAAGRTVAAPAPIYEKQICVDLLKAKLEAMDRGGADAADRIPQAELCARCRAVFRELDLVRDACSQLGAGALPPALRARIVGAIRARDADAPDRPPRRGRPPVAPRSAGTSR